MVDVNDILRAELKRQIFEHRQVKLSQNPDMFNFGQSEFSRTNTLGANFRVSIRERVLSISYTLDVYMAGAMHPNHWFQTYVFALEPLFRLETIKDIFEDTDQAFEVIQRSVRESLTEENRRDRVPEQFDDFGREWIDAGTADWKDFRNFSFSETGAVFLFAPYHVASYAEGFKSAEVSYGALTSLVKPFYKYALGTSYL